MSESPQLITRREALKRGAIAGGAVLWAVPVVQTLGMGRAFAAEPSDQCVATWATEVFGSSQGLRRDGAAVLASRSNPANALHAPGNPPANAGEEPYFSLGFRGSLIVKLGTPYHSGKNGEALVVETTEGSYPLEAANVYVGESGTPVEWKYIGTAVNTGTPALDASLDLIAGLPPIITHVRIVDVTDPNNFPLDDPAHPEYAEADGFDVNAVGIGCP